MTLCLKSLSKLNEWFWSAASIKLKQAIYVRSRQRLWGRKHRQEEIHGRFQEAPKHFSTLFSTSHPLALFIYFSFFLLPFSPRHKFSNGKPCNPKCRLQSAGINKSQNPKTLPLLQNLQVSNRIWIILSCNKPFGGILMHFLVCEWELMDTGRLAEESDSLDKHNHDNVFNDNIFLPFGPAPRPQPQPGDHK